MVLCWVNLRIKGALILRALPAPPAPGCPWVLPSAVLASPRDSDRGDCGPSAPGCSAVGKAGSRKGGHTGKGRRNKTSVFQLAKLSWEMQRNPLLLMPASRSEPWRIKIQNSTSNLWLVFTFCKRNLAEQIPPETADLCRLQGHVKKLLHAEF